MRDPENNDQLSALPLETCEQFGFLEAVQSELEQVHVRINQLLRAPNEQIAECLRILAGQTGKMLRPSLVLLSGKCFGPIGPAHIDLAAMVELLHRASLLHDDVIDSAELRRDKKTANILWGNTAAVLLGDFLLSQAFYLGTKVPFAEAGDIMSRTAQDLCCGELQQNFQQGNWEISEQQYFQLIDAKTAALFRCSCQLGAIAVKASDEQIQAFGEFGTELGIAFQITDDLLDMTGNEQETGKTLGTDLLQGKCTLPVIHWIHQHQEQKNQRIDQLKQGCSMQMLVEEMKQSGSLDAAVAQAQWRISQATEHLEVIPPSQAKDSLSALLSYVADRIK
ncbi:MAG: polyprenyl synthetase family protein [Planctomycetes bacterium]|nr:polyprenyl synthetase family protein [Planctomycetota bacterium]